MTDYSGFLSTISELAENGRLDDALNSVEHALSSDVRSWQLLYAKAKLLERLGKESEAIMTIGEALALEPSDQSLLLSRGCWLARSMSDNSGAIRDLERVLEVSPDCTIARLHLANVWLDEGDAANALLHAKAVFDANPKDTDALFLMSSAYQLEQDLDAAVHCIEQACRLSPNGENFWKRGTLLAQLERHSEAIQAFRSAIVFAPDDYGIWLSLGAEYSKTGQAEEAIEVLETAQDLMRAKDSGTDSQRILTQAYIDQAKSILGT